MTQPTTVTMHHAMYPARAVRQRALAALLSLIALIAALFIPVATRAAEAGRDYVIGSGDVLSGSLAKKMFDETGCDGILLARGALGNPWLFGEVEAYLKDVTVIERPLKETIVKTIIYHLNSSVKCFGVKRSVPAFRKFFCWYTKGLDNVRPLRVKACAAATKKEMSDVIKEILRPE